MIIACATHFLQDTDPLRSGQARARNRSILNRTLIKKWADPAPDRLGPEIVGFLIEILLKIEPIRLRAGSGSKSLDFE